MKTITFEEWEAEGIRRFGEKKRNWKFICPSCKAIQCGQDFIDLGMDINEIPKYLGYSCIGRFNNKKTGCDWTLGGLLQIHEIEITMDGEIHKRFEFAPEELK